MTPTNRATTTTDATAARHRQAAALAARTGIPVLLLATEPDEPVLGLTAAGRPRRYTSTIASYRDGLRAEVHTPAGPTPEQLVRRALPGAATTGPGILATPREMTWGVEARHDGLLARAGIWCGWTLLHVTVDPKGRGPVPALRLVGTDTLPTGRPGLPAGGGR
ncbi:hypothetical protein ACFVSN_30565 [Kitasatospora sp. NPDC057904]|uniref:hypothetical protein n=1 Tax=Kitasatospora sp. NPDC057904 TaxID=3346275 RepID=UPI0036DE9AA1